MAQQNPAEPQINIELSVDLEAIYSNFAIIRHSPSASRVKAQESSYSTITGGDGSAACRIESRVNVHAALASVVQRALAPWLAHCASCVGGDAQHANRIELAMTTRRITRSLIP